MLRSAFIFLAMALAGILAFAVGIAGFGPCGPTLVGYFAILLILAGLLAGALLLTIAAARAGRRRWRHSRIETRLQPNLR